ncbi:hypothetical protein [Dyella nitratireducens]|nr:hypothetical protein [Dyella nitratireducens]
MLIPCIAEDNQSRIRPCAEHQTGWPNQPEIALLLDSGQDSIGLRLKNFYEDDELSLEATTEKSSVVQSEGTKRVLCWGACR